MAMCREKFWQQESEMYKEMYKREKDMTMELANDLHRVIAISDKIQINYAAEKATFLKQIEDLKKKIEQPQKNIVKRFCKNKKTQELSELFYYDGTNKAAIMDYIRKENKALYHFIVSFTLPLILGKEDVYISINADRMCLIDKNTLHTDCFVYDITEVVNDTI